jgi:hypothetical protein
VSGHVTMLADRGARTRPGVATLLRDYDVILSPLQHHPGRQGEAQWTL